MRADTMCRKTRPPFSTGLTITASRDTRTHEHLNSNPKDRTMDRENSDEVKKRDGNVDLLKRDTRIQQPTAAQVRLPVPTNLAGYDPVALYTRASRSVHPAYCWLGHR